MTDDEIRSYMDFDRLLEMHKKTSVHHDFLHARYLVFLGIVAAVGIFSWIMFFDLNETVKQEQTAKTEKTKEQTSGKKEQSGIADSTANQLSQDVLKKGESTETQSTSKSSRQTSQRTEQAFVNDSVSQNITDAKHDSEKPAVNLVYVQAAPVNGYPDLYEYFHRELKYPQEAIKDSIRGEVIAVFTINTQGLPESIVIENSLGPLFDKEVVRLVTNMPPWKPATYNAKPMASKMSLPLTFQIKKIPSQK